MSYVGRKKQKNRQKFQNRKRVKNGQISQKSAELPENVTYLYIVFSVSARAVGLYFCGVLLTSCLKYPSKETSGCPCNNGLFTNSKTFSVTFWFSGILACCACTARSIASWATCRSCSFTRLGSSTKIKLTSVNPFLIKVDKKFKVEVRKTRCDLRKNEAKVEMWSTIITGVIFATVSLFIAIWRDRTAARRVISFDIRSTRSDRVVSGVVNPFRAPFS